MDKEMRNVTCKHLNHVNKQHTGHPVTLMKTNHVKDIKKIRMTLSKVTQYPTKAQQPPLIQSSLIHYQIKHIQII